MWLFRGLKVAEELCLGPTDQYYTLQMQGKTKTIKAKPYAF